MRLVLLRGERARNVVDHAKGTQRVAIPALERRARVEADMRLALHRRIVLESRVVQRVGNGKNALLLNLVGTERDTAWGLPDISSNP